jgi:CheY-like chemotaxis protein/anti-sigma regulatory factor (Ser/Thr protein kinase)
VAPEAALESAIKLAGNVLRHRAALVRDYGTDTNVSANAARLEQVFLNLLVNAAQAFPDDRPRPGVIKVSTRAEGPHRVLVEIADDGPGIPAADLPRVFEPFFTTKPDGIGTGLGLAISRTIIDSFGGDISVRCPPEGGTTVSVRLPAAEGAPTNEATPTPPPVPAPLVRGRLLIVDDEVRLASVLLTLLGDHHDVQVATGAEEALAVLRSGADFDVVLCDLMMPVMTGMDLHEVVSRERPDLARRFVFLTGGAFTERAAAFVARRDVVVILKPFDLAQVEAAIQARLPRR